MEVVQQVFSDSEKISKILSKAIPKTTNEFGETEYESKDKNWLKFSISSMYYRKEFEILVELPIGSLDFHLERLFKSEEEDEVIGTALLLRENELRRGVEFREQLTAKLESTNIWNYNFKELARPEIIIYTAELIVPFNRRDVIGKKHLEIESDANHFLKLVHRADDLLKKINRRRKFIELKSKLFGFFNKPTK